MFMKSSKKKNKIKQQQQQKTNKETSIENNDIAKEEFSVGGRICNYRSRTSWKIALFYTTG